MRTRQRVQPRNPRSLRLAVARQELGAVLTRQRHWLIAVVRIEHVEAAVRQQWRVFIHHSRIDQALHQQALAAMTGDADIDIGLRQIVLIEVQVPVARDLAQTVG